MTDEEFRDWLARDNEQRCVLVELDYIYEGDDSPVSPTVGTLYLSDREFFDHVTNFAYIDVVRAAPQYSRSLSGDRLGSYSSTVGTLELDNADGELDFLLNLACDGSQIRFYYGGQAWPVTDFKLIFSAITSKASAPAFDGISVALKDTGHLLNQSIGGTSTVGGTGPNADRSRPANLGYIHNLEPLVIDETVDGGKYAHSDDGTDTEALEVRDRGVSVGFTDDADGTFRLTAPPDGKVTCDVLAEPLGADDVLVSDHYAHWAGDRAGLVAESLYDGPGPTFTPGDDDDYKLGLSLPEARNVIEVLAQINDSGNSFWAIKRTGEFTFGRLRLNDIGDLIDGSPPAIEPVDILEDDIDHGSFRIEHAPTQYYRFQAYMSRNWHEQNDFATSLSPDEQAVYSRPGLYLMQPDSVGTDYENAPELYHKTLTVSPVIDTLLSEVFSAFDLDSLARWMTTRRAMLLPWIQIVSGTVGIDFYQLELGDPVRLTLREADGTIRYGNDAALFQVIGIVIRLTDAKIELRIARRNVISPVPEAWLRQVSLIDDTQYDYGLFTPSTFTPLDPGAGPLMGGGQGGGGRFFGGMIVGSSCVPSVILTQPASLSGLAFNSQNDPGGGGFGDFSKTYSRFSFEDGAIVTDFHWTGGYATPLPEQQVTSWLVEIWEDSAGVPGTLIDASVYGAGDVNQTFLADVPGARFYTYGVNLSEILYAGEGEIYWISVQATLVASGGSALWSWAAATGAGTAYQVFFGSGAPIANRLAFDLTGCVP